MSSEEPQSVLRKSGSFVELQQLRSKESNSPGRRDKVTVINSEKLPNYSTERYYMLSEIQLKSHSVLFLKDVFPLNGDDETQESSLSYSEHEDHETDEQNKEQRDTAIDSKPTLSPFVFLYLLWNQKNNTSISPETYATHVVQPAVEQILELQRENQPVSIYLVVDRLVSVENQDLSMQQEQIALSEQLIRIIASDANLGLRNKLEGVTIGLCNDARAAPGLEACMNAILVGDAERRHYPQKSSKEMSIVRNEFNSNDPSKSLIGIVTEYQEDLTPSEETDAVQNLFLHTRSFGYWGGHGNSLNFAARAQRLWRETWNQDEYQCDKDLKSVGNEYSIMQKSRRRRRGRDRHAQQNHDKEDEKASLHFLSSNEIRSSTEKTADLMVCAFLAVVVAVVWRMYRDEINDVFSIISELWSTFN